MIQISRIAGRAAAKNGGSEFFWCRRRILKLTAVNAIVSGPAMIGQLVKEIEPWQLRRSPEFERFFRSAAGLDVDKSDLKRYSDFVNDKLYDLLLRAQAAAKANGRDVIEPHDLPITKGLQERIHEFRTLDEEIELQPILDHLAARPPLDLAYGEETEARLPAIAGGISVALARTFKVIEPELKNPQTRHWEMALRIFDLLL